MRSITPEVHAISRPPVDSQFADTGLQGLHIPEIADRHALEANKDLCAGMAIRQLYEPFRERLPSGGRAIAPDFQFRYCIVYVTNGVGCTFLVQRWKR